ncbi:hypothetical protein [Filimonas effusa]|uniref:O-antigen ligase domain-containing protein n=1 Tax=Filimonas effusa TaxID=2508721 RepID=A0A4Q1DCW4_9BACT|nr:hypothetical protein [Filimonas effusa]RXK87351.1 hypothetical protein ESB13_11400 [Filimonas effusa]
MNSKLTKNIQRKQRGKNIVSILIGLILLLLQLFNFKLLPEAISAQLSAVAGLGLIAFYLYLRFTRKGAYLKRFFLDKLVWLFLACMLVSAIAASIYWDQSFYTSLIGYKYFYAYFIYLIMAKAFMSKEDADKIIKFFFFATLIVFLINRITFPNSLFAWRSEERREGITLFFFGHGFTALGGFYFLDKFFRERKIINLVWYILAFVCLFLLTRSRMNLVGLLLGGGVILYYSQFRWKKIFTAFLLIATAILLTYSEKIINVVVSETSEQFSKADEDVRSQAHAYFLSEFQPDFVTYLSGNGYPYGNSPLQKVLSNASFYGFYPADLGFTGLLTYFGIFAVLVWMLMFFQVFFRSRGKDVLFLKAYFLMLLSTCITGYSVFDPGYMPATAIALFLLRDNMIRRENAQRRSFV